MNITVLGNGAIGSLLGGLLAADNRVRLIGSSAGGATRIRLILPDRWLSAIADSSHSPGDTDLLIVSLGRHHLRALKKETLRRLADPQRAHVVFCNCDASEADRLAVPAASRSLALSLTEAVSLQDGDVEVGPKGVTLVVQEGTPVAEALSQTERFGASLLRAADVEAYLNAFFVYQLLFLPVALCNTTVRLFLCHADGRELARRILEEGLKVMERSGRPLAKLPLFDPKELLDSTVRNPASFAPARHAPNRGYSPILQDMILGKPTEARELNKRAVELGASVGLELPWNWRTYQKASRPATIGFYRDPGELLKSLA